jgi:hypothetical protein
MDFVITLLPLVLMLALMACASKVAARVLGRLQVSWKHSFLYAGLVVAAAAGVRALLGAAGVGLALGPSLFVAVVLQGALGAWFFGSRALTSAGQPVGAGGGVRLAAAGFLFLLIVGAALFAISSALIPDAP